MSGMFLCPAFRHRLRSLWHQFFGTIALMEFVLKNPCQQLCSFSFPPCRRSYACPMAQGLETLAGLGRAVFRNNCIVLMKFVLKNPCQQLCIFSVPLPTNEAMHVPSPNDCKPLEKSWAHSFSGQSHWWNLSWNPCQLCFSVCRVLPTEQAVSHGFPSVHHVHASISPLTKLSPSYFPRFPLRSSCRRFHLAPWETSVGKERDGSDDRVEGRETVGNSLGRAPLGRSEIEESTGWTNGKPWKIARGELSWEGGIQKRRQGYRSPRGKGN